MTNKQNPDDWLHLDYFAKLDKRRNPHGMVCILCNKTHWIKDCPYKGKRKTEEKQSIYSFYEDINKEGEPYGW